MSDDLEDLFQNFISCLNFYFSFNKLLSKGTLAQETCFSVSSNNIDLSLSETAFFDCLKVTLGYDSL